jgi:hypothetical protein
MRSRLQLLRSGFLFIAAGTILGASFGCDEPLRPDSIGEDRPDIREWVTGRAAANLNSLGHFVLPDPIPLGSVPIISPRFSTELARGWIHTWIWNPNEGLVPGGAQLRATLEAEHGGSIQFSNLKVHESAYQFAYSPLEELPQTVPMFVHRAFGPHFLIPIYSHDRPVIFLAVAAHSTDIGIDSAGQIVMPRHSGGEFFSIGVSSRSASLVPLWPETAVQAVATKTGARVVDVPELIQPSDGFAHQFARWRLRLDRNIRVRTAREGDELVISELFVGLMREQASSGPYPWAIHWYVPAEHQPDELTIRYPVPPEHWGDPGGTATVTIRRNPLFPIAFRRVLLPG